MRELNLREQLEKDPKMQAAIRDHDGWAKYTFGGLWQGVIYAMLVYMTIVVFGATGGSYLLAGWVGATVIGLFFTLTKYDKVLVSMWNQRELEKVVTEYTVANLEELLGSELGEEYPLDSIDNLDGTIGDE